MNSEGKEIEKAKDVVKTGEDSEVFWYDDYKLLFEDMDDFFPTYKMSLVGKLNAIVRLAIYTGMVLTILTQNYLYLYIPLLVALFTLYIYKSQEKNIEKFFQNYDNDNYSTCDGEKFCTLPTQDNPFMNFNQITDDRYRAPACPSYNNEMVKEEMEKDFNHNLFLDAGDIYSKQSIQFYTMPNTQSVNAQTAFAKWCYNVPATCKENGIYCSSPSAIPSTDQIFESCVNN